MRHLMDGSFKSYFTIDVYGGLIRLPTVLYSLMTKRSNCGTPSGYGGAPRPRTPGASARLATEPDPAISSGGAPDPSGPAPRPRPAPPPRPPAAVVRNATSRSTSLLVRCGKAGIRPCPAPATARIA